MTEAKQGSPEKPEKLRISFYASVDLYNKDLQEARSKCEFIKRMFIVTNLGILILKNIPK